MSGEMRADVVIIGAGIVGASLARKLAGYELDVILCEQALDVATGTSKANSGILHSGIDAAPGTLKAALNVRGLELYKGLRDELGLDLNFTGSLIVAADQDELPVLDLLRERGRRNGVAGEIRQLSKEELLALEPGIAPTAAGALWIPGSGIVCPYGATLAFAKNAVRNGVKLLTDCKVQRIISEKGRAWGVATSQGVIRCRYVVNAAGVSADTIARSADDETIVIKPRKGEYILFDKAAGQPVKTVVFPTPNKKTKGILVAPTTHGNFFIGPNAQDIDQKYDTATSRGGLDEVLAGARKIVPGIPAQGAITQFAGLRAAAAEGDFIIRPSAVVSGLIHAAGIQSPGLTAAPAIAEMAAEILQEQGLKLRPKASFVPVEPAPVRFRELGYTERDELIKGNRLYGRIICRCEQVSEAEIIDAIHGPCGARTLDGVKRRTRAGMGRCQGGFCSPRVAAILSREMGVALTEIRKEGQESQLFFARFCESEVPRYE